MIFGLIAGGTYVGGFFYFSRSHQIPRITKDLISSNSKKIANQTLSENNESLSTGDVQPLINLYKSQPKQRELLKEQMDKSPDRGNVVLKENGTYFGIYKRYKVVLKKIPFTVKSNLEDPTFTINDKKFSNKSEITAKLLPGKYTIRCSGKIDGEKKKIEKTLILSPFSNAPEISFNE